MTASQLHYVAALEQLEPADAVVLSEQAEASGFAGSVVFDRFQPWLPSQGNASFAWTVAGAIAQRTSGEITVSSTPGYRMHPAVVAQAAATLAALHGGRHNLLLSAGDAIDEHIVGGYWPESQERAERLFEAADVIRRLLAAAGKGNDVRHRGEHFRLETARLWTVPETPPAVQIWAGGPVTARRAGRSGMGIVVQAGARERLKAVLGAFRQGRQESGARPARATAHVQLSWAASDDEAMANALRDWPMAGLRFPRGDIRSPFDVDQLARSVTADDIRARIPVSADPALHTAYLQSFFDLGFDAVQVHNVGRNQSDWIELFGREIAPRLGP